MIVLVLFAAPLWAAAGGGISGAVTDSTGAVIASAKLLLVSEAQQTTYHALSNAQGGYNFLNLPVGRYDLTVSANGFASKKLTGLVVDTDASLRVDVALEIGGVSDVVTVSGDTGAQVDTSSTHLGEVVSGAQMTALP